jgi:hypothetical protein
MSRPVAFLIILLFVFLLLSVGAILFSKLLRGGRRLLVRTLAIWIALPALTLGTLLSLSAGESISTVLGVAGVLVSFVFGFAGNRLTLEGASSQIRVGFAFASRSAFHQEIRRSLRDALRSSRFNILDEGGDTSFGREDLIAFSGLVHRAREERVDYMILWPPGQAAADSEEVAFAVRDIFKRGGLCIFLETGPSATALEGQFALIRHDAVKAAGLVVDLAKDLIRETDRVLVVLGPVFSTPAEKRNAIISSGLPVTDLCSHLVLTSWSPDEAVGQIRVAVGRGPKPNVVICPNDSVALALVDESVRRRELVPLRRASIVACDGLPRAFASIAELTSPFHATVAIPPGLFGVSSGKYVKDMAKIHFRPAHVRKGLAVEKVLEMDGRNMIDSSKARRKLYESDN